MYKCYLFLSGFNIHVLCCSMVIQKGLDTRSENLDDLHMFK